MWKLLTWIMKLPIRLMSHIYIRFSKPRFNGGDFVKIQELIRPGDVILSKNLGELTNYFNPSPWPHGAMALSQTQIIEAASEGVDDDYLSNFVFKKDYIMVLRYAKMINDFRPMLLHVAKDKIGLKYDLEFEPDDDEYYCFELIAKCYKEVFTSIVFEKKKILGGAFYTSDSFLNREDFEIVYDSRK